MEKRTVLKFKPRGMDMNHYVVNVLAKLDGVSKITILDETKVEIEIPLEEVKPQQPAEPLSVNLF